MKQQLSRSWCEAKSKVHFKENVGAHIKQGSSHFAIFKNAIPIETCSHQSTVTVKKALVF